MTSYLPEDIFASLPRPCLLTALKMSSALFALRHSKLAEDLFPLGLVLERSSACRGQEELGVARRARPAAARAVLLTL